MKLREPLSYRQIAAIEGISHMTVKEIEKRALKKLKRAILRRMPDLAPEESRAQR